jgi:glutathione S-transferase
MQLYFKPGACSLSSRIVMHELDMPFSAMRVDTNTGVTEAGADYLAVNPLGYVPALEIAPGVVITENPAILQYLADQAPQAGLAPAAGTLARTRMHEWLNFTSSELHKAFGPWFSGRPLDGAEKTRASDTLARRIGHVERALSDGRDFILGGSFSVTDAYLFVVLSWTNFIGEDMDRWPSVAAYLQRIAARSAVRQAMAEEGLLQTEAA